MAARRRRPPQPLSVCSSTDESRNSAHASLSVCSSTDESRNSAHASPGRAQSGSISARSARSMAGPPGVGKDTVARIRRSGRLRPRRIDMFKLSADPDFEAVVRDSVGLCVSPPAAAAVFASCESTYGLGVEPHPAITVGDSEEIGSSNGSSSRTATANHSSGPGAPARSSTPAEQSSTASLHLRRTACRSTGFTNGADPLQDGRSVPPRSRLGVQKATDKRTGLLVRRDVCSTVARRAWPLRTCTPPHGRLSSCSRLTR